MSRLTPTRIEAAETLPESDRRCTCCQRALRGKVAWLELDQRTDTYHDHGGVPDDRSQGWFPFGLGCAKAKLKEHAASAAKISAE